MSRLSHRRLGASLRRLAGALASLRLWALVSWVVLGGCRQAPPAADEARERRLVVFAAASLQDVFKALAVAFEREHPGVTVALNFAGTQELRAQLQHGAPADVFAAADAESLDALARLGLVARPVVFARNDLVMVVARDAASALAHFRELPRATRLVVAAPEVPLGRYTQALLGRAANVFGEEFRAQVEARIVSQELSARQVLGKVSLGEVEAGIVYRTDARVAGAAVAVIDVPADVNVVAEYALAVVTGAEHPELSRAWVRLLLSAEGRRALRDAGFLLPPSSGEAP